MCHRLTKSSRAKCRLLSPKGNGENGDTHTSLSPLHGSILVTLPLFLFLLFPFFPSLFTPLFPSSILLFFPCYLLSLHPVQTLVFFLLLHFGPRPPKAKRNGKPSLDRHHLLSLLLSFSGNQRQYCH
ncbi:MAG: hypothetical protein BYD32DRAFT_33916 [Podila humilis]|nr:MAG: hypothetical protein BYD32DRAFT_33916 [Podila humilis]